MTTTAGNGKRSEVPPSVADAERAARVLVDAGVSQVMLFGSVARGEQTEAARNRGFWLCWRSVWGSCYKESAGCVVVVVGEPVGDSS